MKYGQQMAFFVGGPNNGTTMILNSGVLEYRHVSQKVLIQLTQLKEESGRMEIGKMPYDLYIRTHEMRASFYKGCYIFEWIGER